MIADPSFNEGKVEEAMRAAYKRMDHFILERATAEKWKDGSTGVRSPRAFILIISPDFCAPTCVHVTSHRRSNLKF